MVAVPSNMIQLGSPAPDFSLPEPLTSRLLTLKDFQGKQALLVMFICNHCPYVIHLKPAMAQLARDYIAKGVGFIAISSNDSDAYPSDSPENMIADAKKFKYPFPYLFDDTQQVAQKYSAACTPDFFLFDSALKLAYRGQFDDSRPSHRTAPDSPSKGAKPSGNAIRSAIDLLLAGKSVPADDQKPSLGCNIKWRPGMEPDWFRPYMHG